MDSKQNKSDLISNKQWPQWLCSISACLGLFCCGLCFGWSSPSLEILQSPSSPIPITNSEASWIASLLQLGSALGPIPGSMICKYFGLKICILVSIIPYSVGFILIIIAESPGMLYASRIISGLAVGLSYSSTPIYISEISENRNRGGLMILFTLSVKCALFVMALVAPYLSIKLMAGIMLIFPILLLSMYFAPESPLYYVRINKETKALKSLQQLRRQNDLHLLKNELDSMKMNTVKHMKLMDCFKELFIPTNLKAFGIVFLTIFAQQMSGALIAMLYLEGIYSSTGIQFPSNIAAAVTYLLMFIACFISISFPDKIGRKRLILISATGCIIANAMVGSYFIVNSNDNKPYNFEIVAVIGINLLELSATIGLNSVPYIIAGEIFSANVKELAICIVSIFGAACGFLASKLFQVAVDALGTGTVFLTLMAIILTFAVFIYLFVPETNGKSFNEIQNMLKESIIYYKEHPISQSVENLF